MHFVIGILITGVLAFVLFFLTSCTDAAEGDDGSGGSTEGESQKNPTHRQRLAEQLGELARADPPTELSAGAMCYAVGPMPEIADYVCPDCGEKTHFDDIGLGMVASGIDACRRLVAETEGLDISLDESEFCRSCSDVYAPELVLSIQYDDESLPRRVRRITSNDLRMLQEFLAGEDVHDDGADNETPLQNHIDRLAYLLGTESATRTELEQKLAELARSEPPTELAPGAMCYEIAAPPERAEYVCPTCGERTLYEQSMTELIEWNLETCRRRAEAVTGLYLKLDESELCQSCSPGAEDPSLALLIRYAGETEPVRIDPVSPRDIQLVAEFLSGSKVHDGGPAGESLLAEHAERLAELLDLEVPTEVAE